MARIELNVVALGNFTSVNTQIDALQAKIVGLNKSVAGVGIGSQLAKDLAGAQAAFKATMLSTGQFTATTVKMTAETEKFGLALAAGKLKLSDYFNIITGKAGQATASLKALAVEQVKLQNSVVMSDATKRGIMSVYTPTQIHAVTDATKLATMQQNLYNMSVRASSTALITWGKNTQWAGRQLTVGLTMPMVIFGAAAVKSFKDTNTELTRLQRLYGVGLVAPSTQQITQISNQVLNLGKRLAESMGTAQKDTAATAADFAAIGRTGDDLLTSTEQAMRLSKLGSIDAHTAFTGIMSLQQTFKVSSTDLAESVNFLTAIQKQTALNLTDITDALPRIGPIVKQLGGTYRDTAVMMLSMKEAGVPAAQAANAIKSAMASLISPTAAAKDMFKKFNINLSEISTSTGGNPVKMIQSLQQALQGIEPLARAQLIEKLFGKFQFARVTAMLDNLGKAGSQTQLGFKIAAASATELSTLINQEMKIATESTTAKWARAIEGFKATIYPVGQKFLEMGTIILNFANKIGKAFSHLPAPVKSVLGIFAGISVLAGPIIMLTGLLANFAGYILKAFINIKELVTGGKSMKQLLTPEIIASQNAAKLFSSEIAKDVDAVDLLNQAIKQLTVSLEGMSGAMNMGTASSAISSAAAFAGGKYSGGSLKELNRVHMTSPIMTMGYNEAVAAAKLGSVEINGAAKQLNAGLVNKILNLEKALEAGIISAEEAAAMQFKLLNRDIMYGPGVANRALSRGQSIATESYLTQHMFPGMMTPTALIAEKTAGSQVSGRAQLALEAEYEKLTRQVMIQEEQYASVNASNIEKTHEEVLRRLDISLTKQAEAGDILAQEELTMVRSMMANKYIPSNMAINAGSADVARRVDAYLQSQGLTKTGFSTKEGGSSVRPQATSVQTYGSITNAKAIVERNRQIGIVSGEALVNAEKEAIAAGESSLIAVAKEEGVLTGNSIEEGIRQGLLNSGLKTRQIARLNIEEMTAEVTAVAEQGGLSTGEAYNLAVQKGMNATPIKPKGGMMAMMGVSMGAMMGGQAVSHIGGGNNTTANAAGSMLTNVGMGAMMLSFTSMTMAAMAPLLAGIAALTLSFKLLSVWMDKVKQHQEAVANSYKASKDAIDKFGGNLKDQSIRVHAFIDSTSKAAKVTTILQDNVDYITKADPKKNTVRSTSDLIASSDTASSVIGTAKQFAAAQVANGMDPKAVTEMITAMLTYAGKTQYLAQALKEIGSSTKDVNTATTTWLTKLKENSPAISYLNLKYSDLSKKQKTYADGALEVFNRIMDVNTTWKDAIGLASSLTSALGSSADGYKALELAATNAKDAQLASMLAGMDSLHVNLGTAALVARAKQSVDIKPGATPKEIRAAISDAAKASLVSDQKAAMDTNAKLTADYNKAVSAAKKSAIADSKTTLAIAKAELKILQDKVKAEQQATSEMKAQHDYLKGQADLDAQIVDAKMHGNYILAAELKQQKAMDTTDYKNGAKLTDLQKQEAAAQSRVDDLSAKDAAKKAVTTSIPKPKLVDVPTTANIDTTMVSLISALDRLTGAVLGVKVGSKANPIDAGKAVSYKDLTTGQDAITGKVYNDNGTLKSGGFGTKNSDARTALIKKLKLAKGTYIYYPNPKLPKNVDGSEGDEMYYYNGDNLIDMGPSPDNNPLTLRKTGKKMASGGLITGPGTGTSDSISAMVRGYASGGMISVSSGEYVMRKNVVDSWSVAGMNAINTGLISPRDVQRFTENARGVAGNGGTTVHLTVNATGVTDPKVITKMAQDGVMNALKVSSNKSNKTNTVIR